MFVLVHHFFREMSNYQRRFALRCSCMVNRRTCDGAGSQSEREQVAKYVSVCGVFMWMINDRPKEDQNDSVKEQVEKSVSQWDEDKRSCGLSRD